MANIPGEQIVDDVVENQDAPISQYQQPIGVNLTHQPVSFSPALTGRGVVDPIAAEYEQSLGDYNNPNQLYANLAQIEEPPTPQRRDYEIKPQIIS